VEALAKEIEKRFGTVALRWATPPATMVDTMLVRFPDYK